MIENECGVSVSKAFFNWLSSFSLSYENLGGMKIIKKEDLENLMSAQEP